jgi:hypothetical protein
MLSRATTDFTTSTRRGTILLRCLALWLAFLAPSLAPEAEAEPPLISAVGVGRPPADASSPSQARAMAERSAFLEAIREAARKSGRSAPYEYQGRIREGSVVKGFRINRVTPKPDGSVEVEVSVPASKAVK